MACSIRSSYFIELEPPLRNRTVDLLLTISTAPCTERAGCTDATGYRTDSTGRAGSTRGAVPRPVPRAPPGTGPWMSPSVGAGNPVTAMPAAAAGHGPRRASPGPGPGPGIPPRRPQRPARRHHPAAPARSPAPDPARRTAPALTRDLGRSAPDAGPRTPRQRHHAGEPGAVPSAWSLMITCRSARTGPCPAGQGTRTAHSADRGDHPAPWPGRPMGGWGWQRQLPGPWTGR